MSASTKQSRAHLLQSIAVAVILIAVWEGACRIFDISSIVLPTPSSIVVRLYALFSSGMIWPHLWATLVEILSDSCLAVSPVWSLVR